MSQQGDKDLNEIDSLLADDLGVDVKSLVSVNNDTVELKCFTFATAAKPKRMRGIRQERAWPDRREAAEFALK